MGSKIKRDMTYKESVVSSTLDGKNISIKSNNINLEAAKLKANQNIIVDAKNDIQIIAKQYREGKLHFTKKSSWGGLKQTASMDRTESIKAKEAKLQTEALNIILKSGNDIKVLGSNIQAAADIQLDATNKVLISGVQELLQKEKWKKSSTFNPFSLVTSIASLGVLNLGSIYKAEYKLNGEVNKTTKSSSLNAGNNININSGSAKVVGSNLNANNSINAKTDVGSIDILSAEEEKNTYSQHKKIDVKMNNIFSALGSLVTPTDSKIKLTLAKATYDDIKNKTKEIKNKSSNLSSYDGNIDLKSDENINIAGSNLNTNNGDISLDAQQNVNIKEVTNTKENNTKETHAKAEINATIQNEYVEAAKAYLEVAKAAKQLKNAKSNYKKYKNDLKKLSSDLNTLKKELSSKTPGVDKEDISEFEELISDIKSDEKYYLAAIAAATVNLTSKTTLALQQTANASTSEGTLGFSFGLSADIKGSKTNTNIESSTAVASNLNGNNINIKTGNDLNNQTNISGSNLNAKNDLTIDTNELNVSSSTNTSNSENKTKDISGSVSMSMYSATGPQVSLGYGQNHSENSSVTNNNSQLNATNISTTTTADTNIKGANVNASELLKVIVGGDLNVESQKDTYNANNKGLNISAGFGLGSDKGSETNTIQAGNGEISSANGGYGASNGRTKVKQTVLTSVSGKKVDIKVANNTNLKGSVITAGTKDKNGNIKDNGNLNLETNTITYQNSTNRVYGSSNSFNVSAGIGIGEKTNKDGTKTSTVSLSKASLDYENSKTYEKSKTLATIGEGNLNIKDKENSDDTTALNRDTNKVQKDIYSAKTNLDVDMTVDGRLLTEDGRKQIAKDFKEVMKSFKVEDLPKPTEKQKKLADKLVKSNPEEVKKLLKEIEEQTGEKITVEQLVVFSEYGASPYLGILINGKINGKTDEEIQKDFDKVADVQISSSEKLASLIGIQDNIKNINTILNGNDTEAIISAVELASNFIPVAKAGKYFVKVGDKLVNVSKKSYDKIVDTLKRVEVKVSENDIKKLKNKDNWTEDQIKQANIKKQNLQKAAEDGKLKVNSNHGVTKAERQAVTSQYRKDLESRIESLYANNPTAKQNALNKLKQADIDHMIDLQLGGENARGNLKALDKSVNRSYGKQLDNILKDLVKE